MPLFLLSLINPAKIFRFVLKYWKIILPLLVAGVIWWYVNSLKNQIEDLTAERDDLKVQLAQCLENTNTLQVAIDKQNAAIGIAVEASRRAEQEMQTLQGTLDRMSGDHAREIRRILNQPKPKTCEEAINFLKDTSELQWAE